MVAEFAPRGRARPRTREADNASDNAELVTDTAGPADPGILDRGTFPDAYPSERPRPSAQPAS
jgi:hypothetical protein